MIDLGFNRRDDVRSGIDFQTNGITVGADTRLNETLAVGAGLGYGRDESDIGLRGTASSAEAWSSFVYASWLPRDKLFVDGVLGVATMDDDAVRFLTQTRGFLGSQRSVIRCSALSQPGTTARALAFAGRPTLACSLLT